MAAALLELHNPAEAANWLRDRVRGDLHADSRQVRAGDGFIAWPGAATDGRRYVGAALDQGAAACLVEHEGHAAFELDSAKVASYLQLKPATGPIAAEYFGHPSAALDVLAVTGTNGKTSIAWWLAQTLNHLQRPCAVIGTLGVGQPPAVQSTGMTTPDPVLLQREFRRLVDGGMKACAIEASSIGIAERRLDGTQVRLAIFTNFTQDHLDYHGSMAAYWQAKAELFAWAGLRSAVINIDDAQGEALALTLQQAGVLDVWTVSALRPARLRASAIGLGAQGLRFEVSEGDETHELQTQLIGHYNVSNLLGVIGALRSLGMTLTQAVQACGQVTPVPGRMDCIVQPGQPLVAVDYAHTPDALDQALAALRPMVQQRGGKLWCVFGCGGDRDANKRPKMAAVAEKRADQVIVTSDNPRSEKPEVIISQILLGLSHRDSARVEADRASAINQAIASADANDVVLVAGKGHEAYQEIGGTRLPFDDKQVAHEALQRRRHGGHA